MRAILIGATATVSIAACCGAPPPEPEALVDEPELSAELVGWLPAEPGSPPATTSHPLPEPPPIPEVFRTDNLDPFAGYFADNPATMQEAHEAILFTARKLISPAILI